MADKGLIIFLIIVIIVAGGILAFRKYIDFNNASDTVSQIPEQPGGTILEANTMTTNGVAGKTDDFLNIGIGENDAEKFNNSFLKYNGSQNGSMTRLLINAIRDNNSSSTHLISIEYNDKTYTEDKVSEVRSLVSLSSSYNINFEYDANHEYIEKVIIK